VIIWEDLVPDVNWLSSVSNKLVYSSKD